MLDISNLMSFSATNQWPSSVTDESASTDRVKDIDNKYPVIQEKASKLRK